jgi:hypothetical protein
VTLTADVVPGLIFIDWQVDAITYPAFVTAITITMDGPHVATANYVAPAQADQSLLDTVNAMGLASGRAQSLDAKLNAALAAIGRSQFKTAAAQLNAFLDEVRAQTGKSLTTAQAGVLTGAAQDLVTVLVSLSPSH